MPRKKRKWTLSAAQEQRAGKLLVALCTLKSLTMFPSCNTDTIYILIKLCLPKSYFCAHETPILCLPLCFISVQSVDLPLLIQFNVTLSLFLPPLSVNCSWIDSQYSSGGFFRHEKAWL